MLKQQEYGNVTPIIWVKLVTKIWCLVQRNRDYILESVSNYVYSPDWCNQFVDAEYLEQ